MKALGWIVGVLVVLAAAGYGGRVYATRRMDQRALTPRPLGRATPADVRIPFSRLAVPSHDRTLIGWWVRAQPADSGSPAPALLFFHGNRSAISDYVPLQRFLYRQGISSLVFDYSGFGASGGEPTLTHAVQDAATMARVFSDSAGAGVRRVAMGTALGATVLLQAIDSVQPHVSGLVIEGVDASVRESAVRAGHVPERLAPLLPEIGNNVAAAYRVRVPVLALHSVADNRVPFADAERVVSAIPARASLVKHWRRGHSAILTSTRPCDWAPVLDFVRTGTLPTAKVDSTNTCEVEARQLAARADSARQAAARADSARQQASPAETTKSPRRVPAGTGRPATRRPASTNRVPQSVAKPYFSGSAPMRAAATSFGT